MMWKIRGIFKSIFNTARKAWALQGFFKPQVIKDMNAKYKLDFR